MKTALLTLLTALLSGCATTDQTVEARNASVQRVTVFTVHGSSGFKFQYGTLGPGIWKTYGGSMQIRGTDTCEVSWIDETGKLQKTKVDLKQELPKGYSGALQFVLEDGGKVRVRPRNP